MWIANLTKVVYQRIGCIGNITNVEVMTQDCYTTTESCCEDILDFSNLTMGQCYSNVIYSCQPTNDGFEIFGYIIQIFGVLFLISLFSFILFYICKIIYPKVPDNPLLMGKNIQGNYDEI